MKVKTIILTALVTWSVVIHSIVAREAQEALQANVAAINRANAITGLNSLLGSRQALETQVTAAAVTYSDSTTAFLSDSLDGRAAWRVVYQDLQLYPDSIGPKDRQEPNWQAEVWLDSLTGKLLQVNLRNLNADSVPYRMPTPKEAEEQLGFLQEVYTCLPDQDPSVSMVSAIRKEIVTDAAEIIVQYVMYSRHDSVPIPAWVVYFRDISPLVPLESIPPWASRNERLVVNAITGKMFPRTNIPHPVISE